MDKPPRNLIARSEMKSRVETHPFLHFWLIIGFLFALTTLHLIVNGVLVMSGFFAMLVVYGVLTTASILILRQDTRFLIFAQEHTLYGAQHFKWSWIMSFKLLATVPLIWAYPISYGIFVTDLTIKVVPYDLLIRHLALQIFLVAIAEELFFREAVLKACKTNFLIIIGFSASLFFLFHFHQGLTSALIATALGQIYLSLRLAGMNIVIVALCHGLTNSIFQVYISLSLPGHHSITYPVIFFFLALIINIVQLFRITRSGG